MPQSWHVQVGGTESQSWATHWKPGNTCSACSGDSECEASCSMPQSWPCAGGGTESQAWAALWLVRGADQRPPGHGILPNQSVQLMNESASTESKKDQSLPLPLPDLRAIFSANSCRDLIA